jgi:competence protein ComEC
VGANHPDNLGPLACRPAVPLAVLLAIGVLLHDQLPATPNLTLGLAVATIAAASFCINRRFVASALLALAAVLGGAGLAQREHLRFPSDDIGLFATGDARLCTCEVRVADEPQVIAGSTGQGRPLPPRQVFSAEVRRVLTVHGWVPASGDLPVRLNQPNPALAAGQTVRLLGMLQRPRPASNTGEFDWAVYYRRERVTAMLTVTRSGNAHVLAGAGWSPRLWLRGKARHLLAAGFTADRAEDHAVLQALLLGERDPQLREAAADFQQTGVAYQLSVSGLHVALLAGAVVWLCRRLLLRPRWTLAVGTGFILLYAALSVPTHSGVRAVIIGVAVAVALGVRRTVDRPQLVALALIAMLVAHPLDLYTDGLQLSAAVVIAFLLLLPAIQRWSIDPDRPTKPARPTVLRQFGQATLRTIQYSLIAWLATLPLVAADFGVLTPWGVPGGVAMFPIAVLALFTGAAKVVLTLLFPSIAAPAAAVAGCPIIWMRGLAHGLALLPGGSVPLSAPPGWAIVAYYAVLLLPLVRTERVRLRWALRLSPLAGVVGLVAVSTGSAAGTLATGRTADLRVTLLSLGAGQCAVVESPGGDAVLMDAGSSTVPEVDHRIIAPFLQARGDRRLADIFLSHGDYDHISAAGDLAADFHAGAVFTSHHFRRNAVANEPDLELLARLDELHVPPRELAIGDHVDVGGGAAVDVLWPPPDGAWDSNNAGLVLRLTYAGRRVLFPADIQDPAFAGVLQHPERLPADVLVAPHHGSSESLTPAFLAAVHPSVILSSNAERLTAKQRRFDDMVGGRVPLYRTSRYGAITVTITPDGRVSVATYLHR